MSYINDALKKAQKEKDNLYRHYESIISTSTGRQTSRKTKWMIGSGVVFVILLALTAFSLLSYHSLRDTGGSKTVAHQSVKDKSGPAPLRETAKGSETGVIEEAPARSQDVKDMYQEALSHQRNNNLIRAEGLYRKILKIDPKFVLALNNLGVIYMSQKRNGGAISIFSKAIDLKANYVDPYYNLACLYSQLRNIPKSLEYLKTAISINSDVKNWAKDDKDMKNLHASDAYKEMMEQ